MADASRCGDQQSGRPCPSFKAAESRLSPLAVRLLQLGVPVVFDFAGNTPNDRAWVRSIFESANADHVLHYIVASDESRKARLRWRNETKPEGLYFGFVSEDRFDEVARFFTPPSDQENFHVIYYEAEAPSSKDERLWKFDSVPNRLCPQFKTSASFPCHHLINGLRLA